MHLVNSARKFNDDHFIESSTEAFLRECPLKTTIFLLSDELRRTNGFHFKNTLSVPRCLQKKGAQALLQEYMLNK